MQSRILLIALLVTSTVLAGCHQPDDDRAETYEEMGFDGENWPRLDGVTLTILDHGAFGAFDDAKEAFENLTGATVEQLEGTDAGSALNRAALEAGNPTFDIVYGIDNILMHRALEEDIFESYRPLLADRIAADHLFFDEDTVGWPATPVDHGYIAINHDTEKLDNATIESLDDVAEHADQFVTQDPRTSTPGLGYLLATISVYGEDGWKDHWTRLFDGGVLVTSGWSEAYEQHFSGGYGPSFGGLGDRAIVTSYTTSPAYEAYFGANETAEVLLQEGATFHQIETMGIVRGTKNLAAAQAWIEFTLTDDFQDLLAPNMAVYPVVEEVSADETFGDNDPEPGSFEPADLDYETLGENVQRWVREWTDLCEAHDCA